MGRIAPTLSVKQVEGVGSVRVAHGGTRPECPKCKSNEHVVRLWHGKKKMWVCGLCYKVESTAKKEATLKERILHRLPKADTMTLESVLPNRAARRRR